MPKYHHTQIGTLMLTMVGAAILLVGAIALARGSDMVLLLVLLILVVTAGLFASLTIAIGDGVVTLWFGPALYASVCRWRRSTHALLCATRGGMAGVSAGLRMGGSTTCQ